MGRCADLKVGRLRYRQGEGFYYKTVWTSTPGKPRKEAIRGPFTSVEACRTDLRSIA